MLLLLLLLCMVVVVVMVCGDESSLAKMPSESSVIYHST